MSDDFEYGHDIYTTGTLNSSAVPSEIMRLAENLAAIHGPVSISAQASGIHIMLADPELLLQDGVKEFKSRHLSINAEKYLRIGRYDFRTYPTEENRQIAKKYGIAGTICNREFPCTSSMKTGKRYWVRDLLNRKKYPPVEERLPQFVNVKHEVVAHVSGKNLVSDENGNMVPDWVGTTIPITRLPADHPAVEYLVDRGFDPARLEEQFEACYCTEAAPEDRATGVYYSRLPGGCRNSPKGRIVFTVRMHGVRWGYQSRYIDKHENGKHLFWDGDDWITVSEEFEDGSSVSYFPKSERFPQGFSPHKYINAVGGSRNKWLMGFDAAIAFNKDRSPKERFCIIVEGPLDAGKIGPPAIALMGKAFSEQQASFVASAFGKGVIGVVPDNDKAGRQGLDAVRKRLEGYNVVPVLLPDGVKDAGELTYEEARKLVANIDPIKQ